VLVEKVGNYVQDSSFKQFKATPNPSINQIEIYNEFIRNQSKEILTLEFTRERKSMSVLCEVKGKKVLLIKGAPDYLIKNSNKIQGKNGEVITLKESDKKAINAKINELASLG